MHSHELKIRKKCESENIKLTSLREDVIEILLHANKPCSAYDILNELRKKRDNAEPITVYRVLKFLTKTNIAHRLETQKKYILCCHPSHGVCQIFICSHCGHKIEFHNEELNSSIKSLAADSDFELSSKNLELYGSCKSCQQKNSNLYFKTLRT